MSTNFHIRATRKIQVIATGEITEQVQYLKVWQTSSKETHKIFLHDDPFLGYQNYIKQLDQTRGPVIEDVYAEDDIFCERPPLRQKTFYVGEKHLQELEQHMEILSKEGWEFSYEAW